MLIINDKWARYLYFKRKSNQMIKILYGLVNLMSSKESNTIKEINIIVFHNI